MGTIQMSFWPNFYPCGPNKVSKAHTHKLTHFWEKVDVFRGNPHSEAPAAQKVGGGDDFVV